MRNVELWLPTMLDSTFEAEDVDGRRIVVGAPRRRCARQLGEPNAATWKMDDDEMTRGPRALRAAYRSSSTARHAMAVMSGLVRQAVKHRLSVKLDY